MARGREVLEKVPLFAGMPGADLARLAPHLIEKKFR
ncbi:MAG: DUF4123 domain-containing protein [Deltaproteobacteria bacterium]|nr:DUF4123 domain-containing protein [Deltaproteobacteria bacterium]